MINYVGLAQDSFTYLIELAGQSTYQPQICQGHLGLVATSAYRTSELSLRLMKEKYRLFDSFLEYQQSFFC